MAVDEERELSDAYRTTKRVRPTRRPRAKRSLCALFPYGGTAYCKDRQWRGVLHFQLFLARRAVVFRDAGTLS